jgi:AraC-like DNA-binding protein
MSKRPAANDGVRVIAAQTDVLTDVLATAGLRSRLFCRSRMRAPWRLAIREGEVAHFHVIERGGAHLQIRNEKPLALAAGDLVVLMRGQGHSLADTIRGATPVTPLPPAQAGHCSILEAGGSGPETQMLCGSFSFRSPSSRALTALLPEVVHLKAGECPEIAATLHALWDEATRQRLGAQTAITRLTDVLFVQTVREIAARADHLAPSWLAALGDERIGAALAKMHETPATPWTVERLARVTGMSRSPFAARFAKLVGVPPLTYLTTLRLQRAMSLLREGRHPLSVIADEAGYESPAAFSKMFRRVTGASPRAFANHERSEGSEGLQGVEPHVPGVRSSAD